MDVFSRALRRWELMRVGAIAAGAAWLIILAAFLFAAISVTPTVASVVAAAAALLIAGAGFLYAWREPGR